jgi:hypothetical protein
MPGPKGDDPSSDFGDRHGRGPAPRPPPTISALLKQEHRDFSKSFRLSADVRIDAPAGRENRRPCQDVDGVLLYAGTARRPGWQLLRRWLLPRRPAHLRRALRACGHSRRSAQFRRQQRDPASGCGSRRRLLVRRPVDATLARSGDAGRHRLAGVACLPAAQPPKGRRLRRAHHLSADAQAVRTTRIRGCVSRPDPELYRIRARARRPRRHSLQPGDLRSISTARRPTVYGPRWASPRSWDWAWGRSRSRSWSRSNGP